MNPDYKDAWFFMSEKFRFRTGVFENGHYIKMCNLKIVDNQFFNFRRSVGYCFGMDRKIDNSTKWKKRGKKWSYLILVLVIILMGVWGVRQYMSRPQNLSEFITATVKQGDMESTVSALGTVKPSSEIVLTSPMTSKIKMVKLQNGTRVNAGQTIMALDTEFAAMGYDKLKDEFKLKENNVTRLKLQLEKNIREIEIDNEIKKLQVKNLEASLTDAKRLLEIGGATAEEVETAEQNLAIAKLEQKKLSNELGYRKASISSDIENENIQLNIHQKNMDELDRKIKMTAVKAPAKSVITWINNNIGTKVNEGDPLVKLADLKQYTIEAKVSDMHSEKIKVGQSVYVRLGNENVDGRIAQIFPEVKDNRIRFLVELKNPDDQRLRPNMEVDIRVSTGRKENAVFVRNGPAFKGGKIQKVFVVNEKSAKNKEVEIGMVNGDQVEIVNGLLPGEMIILSDMTVFENRDNIAIK